jgi:cobaltochelatase CobT
VSEAQARARRHARSAELCAAAARALSGERDLHFRGPRLHRGRHALPLYAPHLQPAFDDDDLASCRGAADGFGLRLLRSDARLHEALCPRDPLERVVFELLEQFRCESLVPAGLPGVRRNLRHRFEAWSLAFHHAGGTESARGLLLYTVAQMGRARVTGEPVVEATEDLLEATRAGIGASIGHALAGLKRDRGDQAAYAVHARAIAETVAAMLRAGGETAAGEAREAEPDVVAAFTLLLENDDAIDDGFATAATGRSLVLGGAEGGYRVFTTAYDRELDAAALARPALLREYRARLDARIAALGINLARLARELRALFAQPERAGWEGAQEAGRIDGRRLAQLVASPTERRLFRTERDAPRADAGVTLLIDCSGSMKAHIESVAVLVDLLVRALEQAGVASEVLGYTTGAWNGGRAQRDWLRAARPPHPGRLNEVSHLVFKSVATPWRRARPGIAALLKADLFREGIDGEAVAWAMQRSRSRDEARQVLLVFSDGSPMDGATSLANDAHYLDHHLQDVVERAESAGAEIHGVGVGLDLSPYYRSSRVIDLSDGVSRSIFRELIEMIGRRGPSRQA